MVNVYEPQFNLHSEEANVSCVACFGIFKKKFYILHLFILHIIKFFVQGFPFFFFFCSFCLFGRGDGSWWSVWHDSLSPSELRV